MPQRIQRQRTKGWRMPANTVYVGRPGKWGNPWHAGELGNAWAYERFSRHITVRRNPWPGWRDLLNYPSDDVIRRELAGKNLACWCKPGQPCHADVLLEIANGGES